jgi:glycerol kinase
MVGLTRGVNRAHFARAVLESIAFQVTDLINAMRADSGLDLDELRVDGGASVSNIMMQIQADFLGINISRPKTVETTALGAAYLAGLAVGLWEDIEEIKNIREVERVFSPKMNREEAAALYSDWKRAVERSMAWALPD